MREGHAIMLAEQHGSATTRDGREHHVGLSPALWSHVRGFVAISLAIVGTLLLAGAFFYHRLWHPDWTGVQALQALWLCYLAAAMAIYLSWRLSEAWSK